MLDFAQTLKTPIFSAKCDKEASKNYTRKIDKIVELCQVFIHNFLGQNV